MKFKAGQTKFILTVTIVTNVSSVFYNLIQENYVIRAGPYIWFAYV